MRKHRAVIFIVILLIVTGIMTMLHFNTREEVPEGAIGVVSGEDTCIIDIHELVYEQVTGTRVNGKGEEKEVNASGVLLKNVLAEAGITEYEKVSVVADDAYSVEVSAEEVEDETKIYLIQDEEEVRLRLIVFGDKDSKRSVSNVAQIIVE